MPDRAFYSFHFIPDNWRAAQVRSMGVIEGNDPAPHDERELVRNGGDNAIRSWIDREMDGRSVAIVLIGSHTAGRKWVNYEIERACHNGMRLFGVHVHNLKDGFGRQSGIGSNPFEALTSEGRLLADVVPVYDPPFSAGSSVYGYISSNLGDWIDRAVTVEAGYAVP